MNHLTKASFLCADLFSYSLEQENQQIAMLQSNLSLMSSQLAALMEKRRKRKERKQKELATYAPYGTQAGKAPATKKASTPSGIPEITFEMKKELSEKIGDLNEEAIVEVFKIIREGMPNLGAVSFRFKVVWLIMIAGGRRRD